MSQLKIIEVTPQNIMEETLFCIKDVKSEAFDCKRIWHEKRHNEGLRIRILKNEDDKMIGFIEYVPIENAWRPVGGNNFMFVHCMYVYSKKDRNKGYGSALLEACEKDALSCGMSGVCAMVSKGAWMADKSLFEKNGYQQVDERGRFDLLSKKWDARETNPRLYDWTVQQSKYKDWHLIYADQCPWHEKSVGALLNMAMDFDIDLKITKLKTAQEAKNAPSGYGVFSLLHNGKLLEDHYISATRFRNILKKERQIGMESA
ncbi:GNAT family N-acetyltransferase [Muricauda sp. JGD-17]|uniref:GNAT family N-acetyltransferase n=1 Tax=Flagellimonas ochracea TaxID=2696472 RepID=A0A964TAM0_9FLAO|nr:GNAT family N-acetyltransferase [Allomuricauda ochracea]NAY91347.1 GNAT family N-acetyltransferase [Allomuricauda ochracea]